MTLRRRSKSVYQCDTAPGELPAPEVRNPAGHRFELKSPPGRRPILRMHPNPSPFPRPSRSGVRVLVVEDNVDAALTLADLLTLWGYEVRVVHDGLAALEVAPDYRPEAVLLDIGLPKMDGYGVARWLRAQPPLAGVLIVGVTGYGQERDRQLSREAGFDHHLVKPVDLTLLRRLLADASQAPAS